MRPVAAFAIMCLALNGSPACSSHPTGGAQDAGTDAPPVEPWLGTEELRGVWGASPTDAWAVGASGVIVHWDGNVWSLVSSGSAGWLGGVWGNVSNDVWAVGEAGTILHWDGTSWSPAPSAVTGGDVFRVWGTAAGDVWAVRGRRSDGFAFLHWDGISWTGVSVGATRLEPANPLDVWSSGAGDLWTVSHDDIDRCDRVYRASYAGSWQWAIEFTLGDNEGATAIWGTSPDDVWVADGSGAEGHVGMILTARGNLPGASGGDALVRITGTGPADAWAVGWSGTVFHWDGQAWSQVESGTVEDLYDVWATGPQDAWAVGAKGTIIHWDGTAWASGR